MVACLIKNKPAEEPVAGLIYDAIRDTENGSVEGSLTEQIQKMRAAFAVFEYNTDRTILKRIAVWLRYLEDTQNYATKPHGKHDVAAYWPAELNKQWDR